MNKLVLVGNGFDLAHGMKTTYTNFICAYFRRLLQEAIKQQRSVKDDSLEINIRDEAALINFKYYLPSRGHLDDAAMLSILSNETHFKINDQKIPNFFECSAHNSIVHYALERLNEVNWVDIEEIYYDNLLEEAKPSSDDMVHYLNECLEMVIRELERYLSSVEVAGINKEVLSILREPFKQQDFKDRLLLMPRRCANMLLLNFNYTTTLKQYRDRLRELEPEMQVELIHIHGELNSPNNPIIFGFGDEMDDHYKILEKQKDNSVLDYMKSFGYFRTNNYRRLTQFLEGDAFQVEIMGHSCGLSDRVMLNMIFEHPNCKSIKVYYYRCQEGFEGTNFKELTQNISRHFNKKTLMRDLVVDYRFSREMPQIR